MNDDKIRCSQELKKAIDYIRGKCILMGKRTPSVKAITAIIAKYIDKERIWQNEYAK